MNKEDIIRAVAEENGIPITTARAILKSVIHVMAASFERGESVNIRGIGFFYVKDTLPRKIYCPKKGQFITSAGSRKVMFKASPSLKVGSSAGTEKKRGK